MRKRISITTLAILLILSLCGSVLVGCKDTEHQPSKYFAQETVFNVDLSLSTAIGPLGDFCDPGTITFKTDGTASFDIPFKQSAYIMMDQLLGFRIPDFKHQDTYEINAEKTLITYKSTRKGFEEPMSIEVEQLDDSGMKFAFDISTQIPGTVLNFYSKVSQMPEQPSTTPVTPEVPKTIEIKYNVNIEELKPTDEETSAPPEDETFTVAKAITLPELAYTKDKTLFRGWIIEGETFQPNGKTIYKAGDKYYAQDSVTFLPFFDEYINVTFRDNNGASISYQHAYGTNMGMPQCLFNSNIVGQGFAYWLLEGKEKKYYPGDRFMSFDTKKDVVFNAVYAKKTKVPFVSGKDGKGAPFVIDAPIDSQILLPASTFTSADVNKGFAGWKVNGAGSVKKVDAKYTVTEGDMLEAAWEVFVKVTFQPEINSADEKTITDKVVKGTSYYVPFSYFTKEGYHFTHWVLGTSSTKYPPGKNVSISTDSVFTAQWAENKKIKFITGVEGQTIKDIVQNSTAPATLPGVSFENGEKKFGGWTDGITTYQKGDKLAFGSVDITLTAVWLEKMTVQFSGGEGATGSVDAIEGYETLQITLPANAFTKEGLMFGGWTDGTTTYQVGDKYTLPKKTEVLTSVTLTAVWVAGQYAPYTAIFRVEQDLVGVKDTLMLSSIMSMTELKLYPNKTADFVVKFVADEYLTAHAATLSTTVEALRALEKNLRGIDYDYDKEANKLTLTPETGEPIVLTLTKAAKDATAGRLFNQVNFTWAFPVGNLTSITFAAIDGAPLYLEAPATFEAKGVKVSILTVDLTLKIKADGSGVLETTSATIGNLTFMHQFADDYKTVIWLGDSGAFIQGTMTTQDGKRVISVSLKGNTINLTEVTA